MNKRVLAVCAAVLTVVCLAPLAQTGDAPIDCATANEDINRLRYEKKSTLERMAKGVTSIMPIGLVLHTVMGTERKDLSMATGEYNKKIDERILEIVHACGVD